MSAASLGDARADCWQERAERRGGDYGWKGEKTPVRTPLPVVVVVDCAGEHEGDLPELRGTDVSSGVRCGWMWTVRSSV
ncbi:hypothetical protein GCM10023220_35460 [Streptomyces ziwulingensis]|uniref:Uncharacterized protein n=1 Tax=Streptomyces ziwulingensis TaxID=1045501 RepID=A0ABP9C0X2_9ACTN